LNESPVTRKTLDPNLASILDSIRATVGGETPAQAPEPTIESADSEAETDDGPEDQPRQRASKAVRKAAPIVPPVPLPDGGRTVEAFLAELIRPQVDAWLKANLPELIQKMAAEEIARLTGRK
jgi:hypothetical protein